MKVLGVPGGLGVRVLIGEEMKLQGKAGEGQDPRRPPPGLGVQRLPRAARSCFPTGHARWRSSPSGSRSRGRPTSGSSSRLAEATARRRRDVGPGASGFRWDYTVQITDTAGQTVQFREVTASVQSLTGYRSTRTFPLESRVDPHGTVPITIHAHLPRPTPTSPITSTGVQELTFSAGTRTGSSSSFIVRVPLN